MKVSLYLTTILVIIAGCNGGNNHIVDTNQKDTIFSGDISEELTKNQEKGYPLEKLIFLDKDNQKLLKFSEDTILLKVLYHSKKFSGLNDNYNISIESVNKNMTVLDRLSRNKFRLFIKPDSGAIVFDIYLSSKKFIFESSHFDADKKLKRKVVPAIFLSRKTIIAD